MSLSQHEEKIVNILKESGKTSRRDIYRTFKEDGVSFGEVDNAIKELKKQRIIIESPYLYRSKIGMFSRARYYGYLIEYELSDDFLKNINEYIKSTLP